MTCFHILCMKIQTIFLVLPITYSNVENILICNWKSHLICSNCAGQNKIKNMIKFMMWLSECRFMKSAYIVFLIRRHTKNICDVRYVKSKRIYHKKNSKPKNNWILSSFQVVLSWIIV